MLIRRKRNTGFELSKNNWGGWKFIAAGAE